MAEDWASVAKEVEAALLIVGFNATLQKAGTNSGTEYDPVIGPPTDYPVNIIDDTIRLRDSSGTLIDRKMRVLTMAATGVIASKNDRILVRGTWHEIIEVMPLAPGGVDLLFDLEVAA